MNDNENLFLGVDGGQSHTEAIIADERGCILARGFGGPSNHAEQPGGKERLRKAITESVGSALAAVTGSSELNENIIANTVFTSAHFGMTGGAEYKDAIICEAINARQMSVGHDAPTALCGATAGESGVIVIAGTGSVILADNGNGRTAQVGGLGYIFSDEGSGFWLAAQMIRLAIKECDGCIPDSGLVRVVLEYFGEDRLAEVASGFYNGTITRERIAGLARFAQEMASDGNAVLRNEIENGANSLAKGVATAARRVGFDADFVVSYSGGMFHGSLMRELFAQAVSKHVSEAKLKAPIFGPAIGALLLSYRQAGIAIDRQLIDSLLSFRAK